MFIEDCCRYRALVGNVSRSILCKTMIDTYSGPAPPEPSDLTDSHLDRALRKKFKAEEIASFSAEAGGKGTNVLGLGGPLWDEVSKSVDEGNHPDDLWDKLDAVIFDCIVKAEGEKWRQHWTYEKLLQFMCIQNKPVVNDDFGLFRTLGRGGFGLVNGCKRRTSGKVRYFACFVPLWKLYAPTIRRLVLLTTHTSLTAAIVVFCTVVRHEGHGQAACQSEALSSALLERAQSSCCRELPLRSQPQVRIRY